MAINPSPSKLDTLQMAQRSFDATNDAVRVSLGSSSFAIALDSAEDSVATKGQGSSAKASLTNASTGVVVPAQDASGMSAYQLVVKTTATIVGPQACTLEYSPSDSDNVWVASTLTVTPSTTNGNTVAGTANFSIVARRVRVSIAAAITSGTFDIYLVQQG